MKCLIGLLTPEEGEIYYDNRPFKEMNNSQRRQLRSEIGMLFQGSALFDNETVLGNVVFPLKMLSDMSHTEQVERARFCINRVGLENADNKYPSEISGGMQKRVAIARAIALNPRYLFCDEPNSGLDPKTSILIDELLSDITHEYGITTVINTHDMNSVLGIGEHIVFINKGHCDWVGNSKSIYQSESESLNEFVFASHLFKEVKSYLQKDTK
jgi:phospholipid/cholesterol/gamma-HCH transport system ATP-binding protein